MAFEIPLLERRGARSMAARADAAVRHDSDHAAFGDDLDQVRHLTDLAIRQALTGVESGIRRDDALAERLRAVCSEARDIGVQVEHLIVMIKQAWRSVADAHAVNHRDYEPTLNRVVSCCIAEFYRTGDDAPRH